MKIIKVKDQMIHDLFVEQDRLRQFAAEIGIMSGQVGKRAWHALAQTYPETKGKRCFYNAEKREVCVRLGVA